jgi:hypothetical protein
MRNSVGLALITASLAYGDDLALLLERAGRQAETAAEKLSSMACTERVVQTKFDTNLKVLERRESAYDYLVMVNTEGGEFSVEESRLEQKSQSKPSAKPLVASTGFATLLVIFHPHFQSSFRFEDLGLEEDSGRKWRHLRFEHLPGAPTPTVLQVAEREYPISWKGEAWLEDSTGNAVRVRTELLEPLEDIGLQSLRAEVRYAPLPQTPADWAPVQATVEAHTKHQHWRNIHDFTAYRRFEVNAQEKREAVKAQ